MSSDMTAGFSWIGCYTDAENPLGLREIACDARTGELRALRACAVENALYQALLPDGRHLISCARAGLVAVRVDGTRPVVVDTLPLAAKCLCHVAVMPDGQTVCFADYLLGEAGSVRFEGGRFLPETLVRHRHEGHGPNLPRQDAPHCHQAIPLPDGSGYCVVDLGLDRLSVYPAGLHAKTEPLGAGPRHLAFHPDGVHAFLVSELGNLVSVIRLSEGRFGFLGAVSTLPTDWTGASQAAAIRVASDGARVFVSNRGHDSISTFDFDAVREELTLRTVSSVPGSWPRDFDFLPGGELALVALEREGAVASMRYNPATGGFAPLGMLGGFHRPSSVTVVGI